MLYLPWKNGSELALINSSNHFKYGSSEYREISDLFIPKEVELFEQSNHNCFIITYYNEQPTSLLCTEKGFIIIV